MHHLTVISMNRMASKLHCAVCTVCIIQWNPILSTATSEVGVRPSRGKEDNFLSFSSFVDKFLDS